MNRGVSAASLSWEPFHSFRNGIFHAKCSKRKNFTNYHSLGIGERAFLVEVSHGVQMKCGRKRSEQKVLIPHNVLKIMLVLPRKGEIILHRKFVQSVCTRYTGRIACQTKIEFP